MGYRHYFFEVDKKDVEKVKDKTYDELMEIAREYGVEIEEEENWFYFNDEKFMNKECIHEFGKLYWDDTAERIYSKGVPLFTIKETQGYFEDYEPYVMGSDAMLEAIEIYKEKVINYYKSLLEEDKRETVSDKCIRHVKSTLEEWECEYISPLNLNLKHEHIVNSWLYEYQIFELVRLYKTIDWENKCLLFYGW